MENLEKIVMKGPDTRLIRQCREASKKEDNSKHSGMFAYHARGIVEDSISAYTGNWYQLNEAVGSLNCGRNIDENGVQQAIRAFRHAEGWLATYRRKGSILAVLSTEGYKDFAMLAREGLAIVTEVSETYYQLRARQNL